MFSARRILSAVQVRYAVREYACTAIDVIARRTRLAFLNTYAAHEVLPEVGFFSECVLACGLVLTGSRFARV